MSMLNEMEAMGKGHAQHQGKGVAALKFLGAAGQRLLPNLRVWARAPARPPASTLLSLVKMVSSEQLYS
jgi:hypothetical protein